MILRRGVGRGGAYPGLQCGAILMSVWISTIESMRATDWDDDSWVRAVVAGARDPGQWLASALRCKRASDLLRDDWAKQIEAIRKGIDAGTLDGLADLAEVPSVGPAAAFLGGTALENLLKGILVARNPELVQPNAKKPDRMFNWPEGGHDLSSLAVMAEINMSDAHRQTLEVLTDFVGWAGRYPTDISASRMAPPDDRPHGRGYISSEHFEALDEMFESLCTTLLSVIEGWQEGLDKERQEHRAVRRQELLAELSELETVTTDGVRTYVAEAEPAGAASLVVCVACGAEMYLGAECLAAVCRCDILHHCRWDWLAGRYQPIVDVYPPSEPGE